VGLVGIIVHDEILLNIRRGEQAEDAKKAPEQLANEKEKGEHYAIPHGLLYKYISYLNYFCEWIEWLGFALAASPFPSFEDWGAFMATITPPSSLPTRDGATTTACSAASVICAATKFPPRPPASSPVSGPQLLLFPG